MMLWGTVGEKCKIYLSTPNGECPLTPSPIPCGIVELSHTPPLCFAVQNIGEVVRSAGGVKKQKNDSVKRFLHFSPVLRSNIGETPQKLLFLRRGVE